MTEPNAQRSQGLDRTKCAAWSRSCEHGQPMARSWPNQMLSLCSETILKRPYVSFQNTILITVSETVRIFLTDCFEVCLRSNTFRRGRYEVRRSFRLRECVHSVKNKARHRERPASAAHQEYLVAWLFQRCRAPLDIPPVRLFRPRGSTGSRNERSGQTGGSHGWARIRLARNEWEGGSRNRGKRQRCLRSVDPVEYRWNGRFSLY